MRSSRPLGHEAGVEVSLLVRSTTVMVFWVLRPSLATACRACAREEEDLVPLIFPAYSEKTI